MPVSLQPVMHLARLATEVQRLTAKLANQELSSSELLHALVNAILLGISEFQPLAHPVTLSVSPVLAH